MQSKSTYIKLSGLYALTYMGLGAMIPLLSTYLKSIGLSGVQIGLISSIGSLMGILSPPLFGYLSDRTHKHRMMMFIVYAVSLVFALVLPQFRSMSLLLLMFGIFYFFQSSTYSLLDALALHVPIPFGKLRQWGSYGFALAVFVIGYIAERFGNTTIFIAYALSSLLALIVLLSFKINLQHTRSTEKNVISTLLKRKEFLMFLLFCFLVSGTLASNNVYFGLHYQALGGTLSGVGLAFLLFAASEAPIMQFSAQWIKKFGIEKVLILSIAIGIFRWFIYALSPSPLFLLVTFFLQGLFYGPYLVATAEWVRKYIPASTRATAMTLYSSLGFGLGGIFCNFIGGYLLDYVGSWAVYVYYTCVSLLALFLIYPLRKLTRHIE